VTGVVKSVDIPINRLQMALDDGVWFDGSSVEGFARIQESDMLLVWTRTPMLPYPGRRSRRAVGVSSVISTKRMAVPSQAIHAVH
jgi:glutamine synthetase